MCVLPKETLLYVFYQKERSWDLPPAFNLFPGRRVGDLVGDLAGDLVGAATTGLSLAAVLATSGQLHKLTTCHNLYNDNIHS